MDNTQRDPHVAEAPNERLEETQERAVAGSVARMLANPRRVRRV
jgi:hypothetical protein